MSFDNTSDELPRSDRNRGVCPQCGYKAFFPEVKKMDVFFRRFFFLDDEHAVFIADCSGCEKSSVLIEKGRKDKDEEGFTVFEPSETVLCWPYFNKRPCPSDVKLPDNVVEQYEEAKRCMGVAAWHGAAACFRTVVALIAHDKLSDADLQGRTEIKEKKLDKVSLNKKIELLCDKENFPDWVKNRFETIRFLGNAIHQEDTKHSPLTNDQIQQANDLVDYLIRHVYENPHKDQKLRKSLGR